MARLTETIARLKTEASEDKGVDETVYKSKNKGVAENTYKGAEKGTDMGVIYIQPEVAAVPFSVMGKPAGVLQSIAETNAKAEVVIHEPTVEEAIALRVLKRMIAAHPTGKEGRIVKKMLVWLQEQIEQGKLTEVLKERV